MQISLEQEFLFYWLNLSLQEDSCIAKTEPGTSSSAVVIYSLKLHKNHDALKYSYVTGQKDTGTPLQHVTKWIGWGGSGGWLRRWEGSRGRWRMTNAHLTFYFCVTHLLSQLVNGCVLVCSVLYTALVFHLSTVLVPQVLVNHLLS